MAKGKFDINSQKNQMLIAGIIGVVIVLVFYFMFVFQPLLKKIIEYSRREKSMLVQIKNAEASAADKESLYEEVQRIQKQIAYYEERLPKNVDIPQVLEELISMGKDYDIVFVSLEPLPVETIMLDNEGTKGYAEIPIRLTLKAFYHPFGRFVNAIENSHRFMKVDHIRISANRVSATEPHDIELIVSAFALREVEHDATQ